MKPELPFPETMKPLQRILRACLTLAITFAGAALPARAQTAPAAAGEEIRAEIRLYLWNTVGSALWTQAANAPSAKDDNTAEREFFVPKGKEYSEVKCVPQAYSAPISYVGPRKFQLFRKNSGAAGGTGFEVVSEVMLPAAGGRYVVLLEGSKTPRMLVFPYDPGSVAKGQLLLFNATNLGLGVRIGGDKKALAPNALTKFDVASFTDYQMPVEIFEKIKDDWVLRVSTRHAVRFDERNLGILYQRPNDKEVAFTLLPTVAWEAVQP